MTLDVIKLAADATMTAVNFTSNTAITLGDVKYICLTVLGSYHIASAIARHQKERRTHHDPDERVVHMGENAAEMALGLAYGIYALA